MGEPKFLLYPAEDDLDEDEGLTKMELVRLLLDGLTDDERIEAISGFCRYCGSKHLPCYCTRDD